MIPPGFAGQLQAIAEEVGQAHTPAVLAALRKRVVGLTRELALATLFDQKEGMLQADVVVAAIEARRAAIQLVQFRFSSRRADPPEEAAAVVVAATEQAEVRLQTLTFNAPSVSLPPTRECVVHATASLVYVPSTSHSTLRLECTGPVFVQSATFSVVVARCHQLRLHKCHNTTVVVAVSSGRLVLEECTDITICPLETDLPGVDDFSAPAGVVNYRFGPTPVEESTGLVRPTLAA